MIVVVDSITRKEPVELGHIEVEIKVLLEYLFELSNKSKTFCKWCNDEDVVAVVTWCLLGATPSLSRHGNVEKIRRKKKNKHIQI